MNAEGFIHLVLALARAGEWRINRHLTWAGVFSRFFAGPFLRETSPGRDVLYVTSWLTYKF